VFSFTVEGAANCDVALGRATRFPHILDAEIYNRVLDDCQPLFLFTLSQSLLNRHQAQAFLGQLLINLERGFETPALTFLAPDADGADKSNFLLKWQSNVRFAFCLPLLLFGGDLVDATRKGTKFDATLHPVLLLSYVFSLALTQWI